MDTTITLNEWTARTGQRRRYVDGWAELVGLDVTRYNTGNISHASLAGEKISNAVAGELLATKVWLDDADGIHVDYLTEKVSRKTGLTGASIAAAVQAAL